MGKWVQDLAQTEYSSKITIKAKPSRGEDLQCLLETDVIIDFSSASAMATLAQLALQYSKPLPVFVIGSTGRNKEDDQLFLKLALKTPVFVAPNFSPGIYILSEILRKFSKTLNHFGYSPVMIETHHQHKKDSPSGTALSLQRAISPSHPDHVPTHSVRAGEVIGDHFVHFHGVADEITIGHHASDRSIFARGAIEAACWLVELQRAKKWVPSVGILGMKDYFESGSKGEKP